MILRIEVSRRHSMGGPGATGGPIERPARVSVKSQVMKPLRKIIAALDEWQRRTRGVGVPYAVVKKFGDDNANLQVLALAWYGFTAIFPLLLVVVTVLGFVGQKSLGTSVVSTLHKFPVVGTDFNTSNPNSLHGSTLGLLSTYATGGTSNYAIRVPVLVGLVIINSALYYAAFTVLTVKVVGPRGLWPGAIMGGIAFTALITVGTGLLTHQLANAKGTYGTFGSIIGIVTVLLLLAKVSIYGAELNPVLARKLYPRALPMGGEPTDDDFQVLIDLAHAQQRRDDQVIGVGFGENAVANAAADAGKQARERPQA